MNADFGSEILESFMTVIPQFLIYSGVAGFVVAPHRMSTAASIQ